ncbi:hypothetical protein GUJ93_ZPchr0013g37461 [Zizania palustris]|uniref:Uncharacterized protein n=1 Tax=Zizania palustris TaxID=103762 RepID=A0A8J5WX72_ZIZPA|nr:hypothetical protein GUJ93_ZPchr0013g37461 [Zizania palustris]
MISPRPALSSSSFRLPARGAAHAPVAAALPASPRAAAALRLVLPVRVRVRLRRRDAGPRVRLLLRRPRPPRRASAREIKDAYRRLARAATRTRPRTPPPTTSSASTPPTPRSPTPTSAPTTIASSSSPADAATARRCSAVLRRSPYRRRTWETDQAGEVSLCWRYKDSRNH